MVIPLYCSLSTTASLLAEVARPLIEGRGVDMKNNGITCLLFVATAAILAGCSDGGNKFEGKWSCESGPLGTVTISIRNNGGNNYIVDSLPMVGKVNVTFKDGELAGPGGGGGWLSIDKQSGKLIGLGFCEMSRVK
jgi:hypothetical protein